MTDRTQASLPAAPAAGLLLALLAGPWPGGPARAETAAAPAAQVGYVEDFSGLSEAYKLERGDAVLEAIGYYLPLRQTDRITVLRPGGRVVLRLGAAANRVEVTPANSPYTVAVAEAPRSVLSNLVALFGDLITGRHDLMVHEGAVMAGGTPLELRLPGLADGRAQVAAGRRAFGLSWSGGRPDYTVRITAAADGRVVFEASSAAPRLAAERELDLAEGRYTLTIADADGTTVQGGFTAVAAAGLPAAPAELVAAADPPPELAATLTAAWLAGREDGRWALEAYQRCLPWAEAHPPARALARALAQGWVPPASL